jgi:hypothetical protein
LVGLTRSSCQCPIANWIKNTHKPVYVSVDSETVDMQFVDKMPEPTMNLPSWAKKFVNKVDEYKTYSRTYLNKEECLKILSAC